MKSTAKERDEALEGRRRLELATLCSSPTQSNYQLWGGGGTQNNEVVHSEKPFEANSEHKLHWPFSPSSHKEAQDLWRTCEKRKLSNTTSVFFPRLPHLDHHDNSGVILALFVFHGMCVKFVHCLPGVNAFPRASEHTLRSTNRASTINKTKSFCNLSCMTACTSDNLCWRSFTHPDGGHFPKHCVATIRLPSFPIFSLCSTRQHKILYTLLDSCIFISCCTMHCKISSINFPEAHSPGLSGAYRLSWHCNSC